jgi:8-oxo-dGTP pyrophosphatase MutT (NUDIX family)
MGRDSTPQQAAAIPIRRVSSGEVEVCLIRRRNSGKWGIPKGYIEQKGSRQAALNEAGEEAGLLGRVVGESIGAYDYRKGITTLRVLVFVMEVREERTAWQEMGWRERRWCSLEEAGVLLKRHRVWPLFDRIRSELS